MMLRDKRAVIHGAAGAVGSAVARAFAAEGAHVFLAGRTGAKVDALARRIREEGGRADAQEVDVLDQAAVGAHADGVARQAGGIDVMLNAAGFMHVQGTPFAELSYAQFSEPLERYTRANFLAAQAATRHMGPGSVILSLSTPGSRMSGTGFLGYGVTCAAVEAFSRILAGELGAAGIRLVCLRADVIPEALATSHSRAVFEGYASRIGITVDEMVAQNAASGTLLGRYPTLAQVAAYATFAASDGAGAMTGAIANLTCGSLVD